MEGPADHHQRLATKFPQALKSAQKYQWSDSKWLSRALEIEIELQTRAVDEANQDRAALQMVMLRLPLRRCCIDSN